MQLYVFKLFYIGTQYSGLQRQPHNMTIENRLEDAFVAAGYLSSFAEHMYRVCSRTDAGVHALENMFQLLLAKEPNLYEINKRLPKDASIIVYAYAPVPANFQIRPVKEKTYYYLAKYVSTAVLAQISRVKEFLGEHDFYSFTRRDKVPRQTLGYITQADYEIIEEGEYKHLALTFTGDHFGWEQIRRMVGYLLSPSYFGQRPSELLKVTNARHSILPAPAQFLVLLRITPKQSIEWIEMEKETLFRYPMQARKAHIDILKFEYGLLSRFLMSE